MKVHYAIILALILGGIYWYQRSTTQMPAQEPEADIVGGVEMLPPEPVKKSQAPASGPSSPLKHGQMVAAGIRQSPHIDSKSKTMTVTFIKRLQWCSIGDLDFIKAQSRSPDQSEWRLSLEGQKSTEGVDVSLRDMMEKRPLTLPIPEKDGIYALYLCKKSGGNSCSKQTVWNPQNPAAKSVDSLLMNAQVLVRKDGRMLSLPTHQWGPDSVEKIKAVLGQQGIKEFQGLPEIYRKIAQIKPLGAQFNEKGLVIPLSVNNPKCQL